MAQIGTPEGWQRETPGRPDDVSYKIRHTGPDYLAVTIGHPVDQLLQFDYRNYADPALLLQNYGEQELIERYKVSNEDLRAPFTQIGVDTTRIGGASSLHFYSTMIMPDPYYEITTQIYCLRIEEGWVYIACAYETSNGPLALELFQDILARLKLT